MNPSLWDMQTAVFNRLVGDATLASLEASVYDDVPNPPEFPFVTVGEEVATDIGGKDYDAMTRVLGVHVFSKYRGNKEAKDILSAIVTALHEQALSVAGQQVVSLRLMQLPLVLLERDSITRHGIVRFRALTISN